MITNTHSLDYARTVTVTPEQHDQFLWLRLAVDTERDLGAEQYAALFAMLGLAAEGFFRSTIRTEKKRRMICVILSCHRHILCTEIICAQSASYLLL